MSGGSGRQDLLLALTGVPQEGELVTEAARHGFRIHRRCVDAVDLLAATAADTTATVVVSPSLPRLSADVVDRMRAGGQRQIIGVAANPVEREQLLALGVDTSVPISGDAEQTWVAISAALGTGSVSPPAVGVWVTGCWTDETDESPAVGQQVRAREGIVVAVWGPMGSPGRSTIALGLAEALSDAGHRTCIADADTYAPSVTLALAVVEEASGLLVACRHADNGSLDSHTLLGASRRVRGDLHVLGGVSHPDRWPDLRAGALERVWQACRAAFDVTVVDIGFCIEDDASVGAWSRRRNAAARTALASADRVVAVADDSARGAARLVAAWPAFDDAVQSPVTLVRNRSSGRYGHDSWTSAVRGLGVTARVHPVPDDRRAVDRCWNHGRLLGEGARRSGIRRALGDLAGYVMSD